MKLVHLILLLATLLFSACGDRVEISGFVIDARTRRPLAGAVVVLGAYDRVAPADTTGADGAFMVGISSAGIACGVPPVTVHVSHKDYEGRREIYAGSRSSAIIALERK